jgi:glycosyltransferase involved in cell wall biosynthesis
VLAPTRVVVDGFQLGDGSERRGFGTVMRRLLAELALEPDLRLTVLGSPGTKLPDGVRLESVRRHRWRPRLAALEHELRLPRDLRRTEPDVVLSPTSFPPRRAPAPLVQVLHDLTPLEFPHPFTVYEAGRWRRAAPALRRAARIVAISHSTADQGVRLLDLDPARIEVVHHGADPTFTPGHATQPSEPYVLTVGAYGPHKGFAEAMAVIGALAEAGYPHRLRIVGPQDAWMRDRVDELVAKAPRPDRVDVRGYVPDLLDEYRGASLLLSTSRAEGFGLPLLEAMGCGTPVVAFRNTSIPEVVGEAGLLVDDGDIAAAAQATRAVIDDETVATRLRAAGPTRAAGFRWSDAIAAYADVLRDAGARTGSA